MPHPDAEQLGPPLRAVVRRTHPSPHHWRAGHGAQRAGNWKSSHVPPPPRSAHRRKIVLTQGGLRMPNRCRMDPATTRLLIGRARDGDEQALNDLFARHAGRLRLYVHQRLGRSLARRLDVDDVVQETYMRAFTSLEDKEFTGESAFFRYLASVARHTILDAARAARTLKRSGGVVQLERSDWTRAMPGDPPARIDGPATRAVLAEDSLRLEQTFLELPANYRRVITLRQLEQLSAREVADRTGSSEQAVHALYRRALSAWARAAL